MSTVIVSVALEIDTARDLRRGRCSFCRRKVTLADGFLELYSSGPGGRLYYPNGASPVVVVSHAECGPDGGYALALARLRGDVDSKYGWIRHIRDKGWSTPIYLTEIRRAAKLARALDE